MERWRGEPGVLALDRWSKGRLCGAVRGGNQSQPCSRPLRAAHAAGGRVVGCALARSQRVYWRLTER